MIEIPEGEWRTLGPGEKLVINFGKHTLRAYVDQFVEQAKELGMANQVVVVCGSENIHIVDGTAFLGNWVTLQ